MERLRTEPSLQISASPVTLHVNTINVFQGHCTSKCNKADVPKGGTGTRERGDAVSKYRISEMGEHPNVKGKLNCLCYFAKTIICMLFKYQLNTPFAVHYEKIRIHLRELTTNSAKIHS